MPVNTAFDLVFKELKFALPKTWLVEECPIPIPTRLIIIEKPSCDAGGFEYVCHIRVESPMITISYPRIFDHNRVPHTINWLIAQNKIPHFWLTITNYPLNEDMN